MPGAPNRPPETAAPPPPPVADGIDRKVLRRLAPSRVALRLDLWGPGPSSDLLTPFLAAEAKFSAADFRGADSALDQLSVRLAEPRWPSIPEPFRRLRVSIPQPQPPHYDPEFSLSAEEKEARRRRRDAETQIALAEGALAWAAAHKVPLDDVRTGIETAKADLAGGGPSDRFWSGIDALWSAVRERVPIPGPSRTAATPLPSSDAADAAP